MAVRRRVSSGIETKNLKLGQRLIGLFMFMALLVVITGGFGAWSMKRVGDRIQDMLTNLSSTQKLVLLMEVTQQDGHTFPVLVTEVLAHTDLPAVDTVELYNPTSTNVNIGGWFLTDNVDVPKKYRIANGTTIPAGGYATFNANQFGAGTNGFTAR